jgi:adhesin transport system outer membrane protein
MRQLNTLSFASFLLACACSAVAQPANTLKAAVERAILENPEVQYKYKTFKAVGNEQDASKGGWRPRIDLEASVGRENTLSPGLASARDYDHSQATLQLRQTLFDGFATSNDVRRLGHARMAAYYDLLSTSDLMGLETARAYLDVLRYRELVALARENYASHADVHSRLESRVKAGVGRRVDLEQASGRKALAESNWLTEASNLHDVSTRYQRLVGETPAANLEPLPSLQGFLPSRDGFVVNTVRANPEFQSAVSTIRAYRADSNFRRAANYPTVEFRASQSVETNRSGVSGDYRDSALQLVLNYNLYRGGADAARIRQYVDKLNATYDLRDKVCRDVRQTALIAINDVSKLESQIGFLSQHELSTSKAREAYRQQFDIGQRSLLDLLDTENELYQARRALVNAEYDHQLSKARVLASNGSLLSALQLRPLQAQAPEAPSGTEDGDDAILCNQELPVNIVLDKSNLVKPVEPVAVAAPVAAPAPRAKVSFAADALFDFNKADLKPAGLSKLDGLVASLKGVTIEKIVAIGHTDGTGPDEYNKKLSLARAQALAAYLVSKGIDKNLVTAEGRGKTQPVAPNTTVEGRAKNRRVDLEIVGTQAK